MIGVIPKSCQVPVVEEFFELFKTPWELYDPGQTYDVVIATTDEVPEVNARLLLVYGPNIKNIDERIGTRAAKWHQRAILSDGAASLPTYGEVVTFADSSIGTCCVSASCGIVGIRVCASDSTVLRLGYDLFDEVKVVLSNGQPVEHAQIPTLDIHIRMLRNWILNEGISVLEIPPAPAGRSFAVCLTHDIDFVGIRNHKFDHTMWGFLYRSTVGAIEKLLRGRISLTRFLKTWQAVASLPFVYLGWAKDFWEPFQWYLEIERELNATYFFIPFKGLAGEKVPGAHAARRAATYDLDELSKSISMLSAADCELGVHGIDAWHNVEKGRAERSRLAEITGEPVNGIRMHWLLQDSNTPSLLEQAGFAYDSSVGYNDAVGYRAGTGQVYRPLNARKLLELPLHIQDGALFYPQRLDLSEPEAEKRCRALIDNASEFGGVLTLVWHDRSHAPERFWGDFYIKLVRELKSFGAWFATAGQVVGWFQKRRAVRFERTADNTGVRAMSEFETKELTSSLTLRIYRPLSATGNGKASTRSASVEDFCWDGKNAIDFDSTLQKMPHLSAAVPVL